MKLIWFLAMILVVAGAAYADSATVSHAVTIEIAPVKMLEIHDVWKTHSLSQTESGGTLATATTTYGVTCIVENTMIQATLDAPLPEGVIVKLRMRTTIGTSLGWVRLGQGAAANLVSGARGAEYNVLEMELTVPAGVAVSSVPINIAYMID